MAAGTLTPVPAIAIMVAHHALPTTATITWTKPLALVLRIPWVAALGAGLTCFVRALPADLALVLARPGLPLGMSMTAHRRTWCWMRGARAPKVWGRRAPPRIGAGCCPHTWEPEDKAMA